MDTVPVEYLMFFLIALPSGSRIYDLYEGGKVKKKKTQNYPEINVQVAASANLVRDSHLGTMVKHRWIDVYRRT
jgi:hypothetical protein